MKTDGWCLIDGELAWVKILEINGDVAKVAKYYGISIGCGDKEYYVPANTIFDRVIDIPMGQKL